MDWIKGFGPPHENSENESYINHSKDELHNPPFPLLLSVEHFLLSQIPDSSPSDTYIVKFLKDNPSHGNLIINFLVFERRFNSNLDKLSNILISIQQNKFNQIKKFLLFPLSSLRDRHRRFCDEFLTILSNHKDNHKIESITKFICSQPKIIKAHNDYLSRYSSIYQLLLLYSFQISNITSNEEPLIHSFRLPLTWNHEVFSLLLKILQIEQIQLNQELVSIIQKTSDSLKTQIRFIESYDKLDTISKMFLMEPFPIKVPGRQVFKTGYGNRVTKKGRTKVFLILMSDIFLSTEVHGGKIVKFEAFPLGKLRIDHNNISESLLSTSFYIFTPMKSFMLSFGSEEEKNLWDECINITISVLVEEQGEKYWEPAPILMPYDQSEHCLVCKSPFSAINRKKHCQVCGRLVCKSCLQKIIISTMSSEAVNVCSQCAPRFIESHTSSSSFHELI